MERRNFLKSSSAAMAGGMIIPTIVPSSIFGANAPSNKINVTIDGKYFTSYICSSDEKYPFFYPVNGPLSGGSVTSMRNGEYPHHSSLFFGCDQVNGGNYWQEGLERGRIISVNAEGESGEKATFGKNSPWMDYFGKRGDFMEGIAILQHPSNPWYPSPWFTRDYGFMSPTPMYWPANDKETVMKKGEIDHYLQNNPVFGCAST
jgi:hypothetical protein